MSVPARRARSEALANDAVNFDFDPVRTFEALDAGERISPPRERGSSMLGATLVLLVLFGGGWAVLSTPADWLELLGARVGELSEFVRAPGSTGAVSDASSIATGGLAPTADPAAAPPIPETHAVIATDAATPPDAVPVVTASITRTGEQEEAQPLPPVQVDPADPYQKRAAAVGLHPDLARVLLAKLSATDYRNAGYAIDTAVAKIADEAVFVWPRQRKPEQALFRVHFVAGAAPQCRRYVVTVVKDGWSTTALPMERCGAALAGRKAVRTR